MVPDSMVGIQAGHVAHLSFNWKTRRLKGEIIQRHVDSHVQRVAVPVSCKYVSLHMRLIADFPRDEYPKKRSKKKLYPFCHLAWKITASLPVCLHQS